ncbi:DUF2937 family protein [Thalassovita taeanensis]|uniref:DUF2937 family protein n=1 Tax=Thalassovita taeanensis TaxID=657014 RepID=A0A1H9EIH2_9RHOB|nr:DUF2937 family protein [Thalassovita taeanensis]SEQ25357.1 Protein of unknown function [Thalassovita taeanensis]
MFLRAVTLAGGIAGAGAFSQFPEYSQQYTQRLGGAVDELSRVVQDFDASATAEGLTREDALEQMVGTAFVQRRRTDMQNLFARHKFLSEDLEVLDNAGPFTRAYHAGRLRDPEIAARAWAAYRPALPVTFEGAVFGGVGFLAGLAVLGAVLAVLRWPFRWRKPAAA